MFKITVTPVNRKIQSIVTVCDFDALCDMFPEVHDLFCYANVAILEFSPPIKGSNYEKVKIQQIPEKRW